jgi:hypothetical protein
MPDRPVLDIARRPETLIGYDNCDRLAGLSEEWRGCQVTRGLTGAVHVQKVQRVPPEIDLHWTHVFDTERRLWTRNCSASPAPRAAACMEASDGSKWWREGE